ncbi:MAG TPA: monomethylamine:corrinoid methyltransferase [Syntrophomonadaceae bacterium]|nr:monomethylamine:corrinoid methyltransferase [Syntrophomonadaceae bacterium]
MSSAVRVLKTLEKARTGERCTVKEWDYEIVPKTLNEILKKYNLEKTCDINKPVNEDMELADRFYQAGLEAALRLGFLCVDTETIVKVKEEELLRSLQQVPSSFTIGEGSEQVTVKARRPSDGQPPVYFGPLSIQMNEEYYVPVAQGILMSRLVDGQEGPSLDTVMDCPLLANSPYESFAGIYEARLRKEAQWRAGRVGIGNAIVASSSTEYGFLAGFALYKPPQIVLCLNPASMKINYVNLHKTIVAHEYGHYVRTESPTMIGGYTGGPEGSALASIATDLLQYHFHGTHLAGSPTYDLRYAGNCGRHALWAQTIASQAISRNTNILMNKTINQVSGPCTEMFFLETIAGFVAAGVSGLEFTISPRSGGGRHKNHLTPFEAWYSSAVFKGSAGLSAEKANEILNEVLPKYEKELRNPPKGKSFPECFNVKTLQPTEEYLKMYLRMREYAISLGIPMPPDGVVS